MWRKCIIGIFFWGLATQTVAQNFVVHGLPTQEQLPMASVHSILQDAEGYVWYATEGGGLCRDDGYRIDVFRPSEDANLQAASRVHCMTEDSRGRLYFGTGDGLFYVDKRDYAIRRSEADTIREGIETLYTDRQGRVWVGRPGSIGVIDTDGSFVQYPCQIDGKPTLTVRFYEDTNGTHFALLWPSGKSGERPGILRMRRGENAFSPIDWPLTSTPIQMVEDSQHRCYWVLTSGDGVVRMTIEDNTCRVQLQPATAMAEGQRIGLSMLRDSRHGLFWCTTLDNLYAYRIDDDGELQPFPLNTLISEDKKVLDQLFETRDGTIYVSGYTPHTFMITSEQSSIRRHTVPAIRRLTGYPVLADRSIVDGRYIWIWQGRKGLMLYDTEADEAIPAPKKFDRTLCRSSQGGIWASSGRSVFRLWQTDGQLRSELVTTCSQTVRVLHEDHRQSLWMATADTLHCLSLVGHQHKAFGLPASPVGMDTDRQGNVYLALGSEGFWRMTPEGELRRIGQVRETFLSLSVSPDGTLWASTYEGSVYHYRPVTDELKREDFLSNGNGIAIKSILVDGMGHVWTMTDQQVHEFSTQSRAFRTIRNTDPFVGVSYFYALESIAPNRVGIDGAGAILDAQSSGELQQAAVDVRPRLSAILVNGKPRFIGDETDHFTLAPDERDITLCLTTLCHQYAQSVSFAYQLEGITHDWVYLPQGSSSVILNNLPKGSLRLRIMATDRYGCWSAPQELITIECRPHWWETWWAYLLYIALAVLVLYGVWFLERRIHLLRRLIRRRQEVRLDEIELSSDDISEEQRDDEFLRRSIAMVEQNLSRPDYNVEALSDDMCMSRITFYRRIQKQTGHTPSEFIRDIRLKKAAQLLLQSANATTADIARKVGFATPKYFSQCFKEKFGVHPKEYRQENGIV